MKAKKKTARRSEISTRVQETAAVYHPAMRLPEPPAIEKIAQKFGLRQETLSRMTGFSLRAVAGWSNGETPRLRCGVPSSKWIDCSTASLVS